MGGNARAVADAPVTAVFAADLQPAKSLDKILDLEARAGKPTKYLQHLVTDLTLFLAGDGPGGAKIHDTKAKVISVASLFMPGALPTFNSAEGWAFKSTALAAMTYMYACTAAGLATHPMEGFDARAVRTACRIPDRYAIPMVVATGYPVQSLPDDHDGSSSRSGYTKRRPTPRLPMADIFKLNSFTNPFIVEEVTEEEAAAATAKFAADQAAAAAGKASIE